MATSYRAERIIRFGWQEELENYMERNRHPKKKKPLVLVAASQKTRILKVFA
jgi:hypothetical protein